MQINIVASATVVIMFGVINTNPAIGADRIECISALEGFQTIRLEEKKDHDKETSVYINKNPDGSFVIFENRNFYNYDYDFKLVKIYSQSPATEEVNIAYEPDIPRDWFINQKELSVDILVSRKNGEKIKFNRNYKIIGEKDIDVIVNNNSIACTFPTYIINIKTINNAGKFDSDIVYYSSNLKRAIRSIGMVELSSGKGLYTETIIDKVNLFSTMPNR